MAEPAESCKECVYWDRVSADVPIAAVIAPCRRFPPSIPGRGYEGDSYPTTEAGFWCGEFRRGAK